MDLDEFLCADANTDEDEYEDVEDDVDSDFGYGGRSEGTYDFIIIPSFTLFLICAICRSVVKIKSKFFIQMRKMTF